MLKSRFCFGRQHQRQHCYGHIELEIADKIVCLWAAVEFEPFKVDMHYLSLTAKGSLINKKPRITNPSNLLSPATGMFWKQPIMSWYQRSRWTFLTSTTHHSEKKALNCVDCDWLTCYIMTWHVHVECFGYEGTIVCHLVQNAYSITLLAIVHIYQERYSLCSICLHHSL